MKRRLPPQLAVLAALAALLLGAATVSGCGSLGSAAARAESVPPSNTLWTGVRAGVSVPLSATLASATEAEILRLNGSPWPLFGASMMFRTSRFDVGAQFDSLYGGTFQGLEKTRHIGARSRLLAAVRWRGFEATWGSIYSGVGVGVMFFNHHDDLLDLTETIAGLPSGAIRPDTDRFNSGFTFNLGAGIMVYPTRWMIIFAEAEMAGGGTSITAAQGEAEVEFGILRIQVNLGVELRIF